MKNFNSVFLFFNVCENLKSALSKQNRIKPMIVVICYYKKSYIVYRKRFITKLNSI